MNPTAGDPVFTAMMNPQTAPVIIIPSTPRLRTPARSTTSSPMAASRIGVEAAIMAAISRTGLMAERSISDHPTMYRDMRNGRGQRCPREHQRDVSQAWSMQTICDPSHPTQTTACNQGQDHEGRNQHHMRSHEYQQRAPAACPVASDLHMHHPQHHQTHDGPHSQRHQALSCHVATSLDPNRTR
mmetsp:Transcript_18462/g.30093  ORF Transcript_18462/g.30093 Transcript_18462/m.30093 type:complete len:185 (-) Transcript_18462:12291-12845(-)